MANGPYIKNKFCHNCGSLIKLNDKFCRNCGQKIEDVESLSHEATNIEENNEWYYELNGKREGPVTHADIKGLLEDKILNRDSLVWQKKLLDWVPIYKTKLVDVLLISEPPSLSGYNVDNSIIWIIALTPLLGSLIWDYILLPVIGKSDLFSSANSFELLFYFLINSSLATMDNVKLKNAGYNSVNYFWAIFIVPVFLWKRATLTKQSPSYFWVWIISFVFILFIEILSIYSVPFYSNTSSNNSITYDDPSLIVNNKYINIIKEGFFNSHPTQPIGKAAAYFFTYPKWEHIIANDNNNYVNLSGSVNIGSEKIKILMQFRIFSDNTFEVNSLEFNDIPQNEIVISGLIDIMFSSIP